MREALRRIRNRLGDFRHRPIKNAQRTVGKCARRSMVVQLIHHAVSARDQRCDRSCIGHHRSAALLGVEARTSASYNIRRVRALPTTTGIAL